MMETLTLLDLNQLVRNRLRRDFPDTYWISAEISECKEHFSGHCYLELVQKKERSEALSAKARATIWANTWASLKPAFEQQTGTRLQAGQKILAEVSVDFHELYGFSLVIRDIDPTYTMGDLSLRRQQVIKQLTEDGVFELNKELEWPVLPKRLAVISSPSAAGYEDFMDQLKNNELGIPFHTDFFPATMQGDAAAASIIDALNAVQASGKEFDVVVIIRGGGATTDLRCFDEYELCYYCAQYPLPLLTGIGHDRDSSVLDLVAHTSVKTPTAAAEHLIDCLSGEAYRLDANLDKLQQRATQLLENYKRKLQANTERLRRTTSDGLHRASILVERNQAELYRRANQFVLVRRQDTENKSIRLNHRVQTLLDQQKHLLSMLESRLETFSPDLMIKKGFSLTLHNGRILKSVKGLQPGAELQTRLKDGVIYSNIQQTDTTHD
jgi:exodeoxyribonuclease VII large subunit